MTSTKRSVIVALSAALLLSGCSKDKIDCSDPAEGGILAFFVDPPVVYAGIDVRVTAYVSGLSADPRRVALISGDGQEVDLTGATFVKQGQLQAVVPAGLAPGSYAVLVEDHESGCESILPGGVTVTDEAVLSLAGVDPAFGHTGSNTSLEFRSGEPVPAGEVSFAKTPRGYLNPVGGGIAAQVESVAFVSEGRLTGIVPAGLAAGTYDVIVVNPSGEVGILEAGFLVVADPLPEIDEVSPGSLATSVNPQPTSVFGRNFRSPVVELTCRLSDGATVLEPAVEVTGGDAGRIDIAVATDLLDNGTVCAVRVVNGDGTFADFSALTITNPAQAANAIKFSPGPALNIERRAPAAVAGRASRTARFVYTIGGDDGDPVNTFASVEASSVDLFGDLAGWFDLPVSLPAGRTFARAVSIENRFIYLVGGNEGGGPTATTLRAKILDPDERAPTPEVDLSLADDGLDPGIWYYRLSAVMAAGAALEPGGGEILASDPRVIQLPSLPDRRVQVHLTWDPVPEAVAYRIYRTPNPDMVSGDELLLAVVDAPSTSFTDDGSESPSGASPLPLGCTGAWHALGDLLEARESHGLTAAPDPVTAGLFHIYAVSGGDGGGELDSVERLTVTVSGGQQTATAWAAAGALPANTGRTHLEALTADSGTASKVGGDVWLYALSGTRGGVTVATAQAVQVLADGVLDGTWSPVDSVAPARTGYGAAVANNFLFVVGGLAAGNSDTGNKANICGSSLDPGCAGLGAGEPPDLGGWTSLSSIEMQPRGLMGKAVQSGSLYLIGGVDPAGNVLASSDQSPLGGQP